MDNSNRVLVAMLTKPDGTIQNILPKDGKKFTMEELYELIGCTTVEMLMSITGYRILVDEDANIMTHKPLVNQYATDCLHSKYGGGMQLRGNAVICSKKYF